MKKIIILILLATVMPLVTMAQEKEDLTKGLTMSGELQVSSSDGTTPLWLNANKYGLSSLKENNGYIRVGTFRKLEDDTNRQWQWGYGIDIVGAANYDSKFIVQQAYAELKWKKLKGTLGSKQQPVALKNQELSSGALAIGSNARPIPQARLDIDWFSFPGTHGWWKLRLYGTYGMTTDGNWQEKHHCGDEHYTGNVMYHEKALYMKFGRETSETLPVTYEFGLQTSAQIAGTLYNITGRGYNETTKITHKVTPMTFIKALTGTGFDETDGSSHNVAGNNVGSWNMRLTWHGEDWKVAARFERLFEDWSMFFVQYGILDHLLGLDVDLPKNHYVSAFTIEHLSTYDQSGSIMHDWADHIHDKMNGRDNYYNHNLYCGYKHWGQNIGNPLLTSVIYNTDQSLVNANNRVRAWHIGLSGDPVEGLHWRALVTFSCNYGTYDKPLEDPTNQQYYLLEATAAPKSWNGWQAGLGLGLDHGKLIGNNYGAQLTVRRIVRL